MHDEGVFGNKMWLLNFALSTCKEIWEGCIFGYGGLLDLDKNCVVRVNIQVFHFVNLICSPNNIICRRCL